MPKFSDEIYIELWDRVKLTDYERNAMIEAIERGDIDEADQIVDDAYERLFDETSH